MSVQNASVSPAVLSLGRKAKCKIGAFFFFFWLYLQITRFFLLGVCAAFVQSSDLGGRGSKAGLFPGNQRLSSGASPLRRELRFARWNRATHQAWLLPQLLCEPGNPTHRDIPETDTCHLNALSHPFNSASDNQIVLYWTVSCTVTACVPARRCFPLSVLQWF